MTEVRSGFVPVVGRPNVGKSTLVNALVGEKVSIISSRPQTTRNTIRGVVTGADDTGKPSWQLVLVDTPGVHKPRTELGNRLNSLVYGTLTDADVVVFVIDATQRIGPGDRRIAERLKQANASTVVVVNKVDATDKGSVVSQLDEAAAWSFDAYVPLSALRRDNLAPLVTELVDRLPEGPLYFDPETRSDQADLDLAAEIIREKFLDRLHEEVPHSLIVVVDDMVGRSKDLQILAARVIVERSSQKGIVIGKGGSLLKIAGTEAREELESLFGTRLHLDLRVTVEPDWQTKPQLLDRLGFGT